MLPMTSFYRTKAQACLSQSATAATVEGRAALKSEATRWIEIAERDEKRLAVEAAAGDGAH